MYTGVVLMVLILVLALGIWYTLSKAFNAIGGFIEKRMNNIKDKMTTVENKESEEK